VLLHFDLVATLSTGIKLLFVI